MPLASPPLQPDFAVEITGMDLAHPLSPEDFAHVQDLRARHGVLVFRDQKKLSYDGLRDFANRLGRACDCDNISNLDANGNILDPDERASRQARGNTLWHMDMLTLATPPLFGLLLAQELPVTGGETQFADMSCAWENLPPALRDQLARMRAVHSIETIRLRTGLTDPEDVTAQGYQPARHPLVTVEPYSNRPTLMFGNHTCYIDGLSQEESAKLLNGLMILATQEAAVYTHRWRLHDLLVWNNRRVMHRVLPYDLAKERRCLWRMEVVGAEAPRAYAA